MKLGFFPSANYWRNTFRTLDYSRIAYYSLSILLPAAISLSWLLREKSRQQSFYDAGYEFVPDHRVQCKRTIYPAELGGVDYDDICEGLLDQTFGLFWEMFFIPIVSTLIFAIAARSLGLDAIVPAYTMVAWLLFSTLLGFVGLGLAFFVQVPAFLVTTLLVSLIPRR